MEKQQLNRALCLILVAGQQSEAIDGTVYAAAITLGIDLPTYNYAKHIAIINGLVVTTGAHTYRDTSEGTNVAKQIEAELAVN